jgi:hypothetical protein
MRAVEVTRAWVSEIVVGLNLCPFAERALNKTRFTQSDAETPEDLLLALGKELQLIASAPRQEIETTLLICPRATQNFLDFNELLGLAENLVHDLQLEGTIQVVGFHPLFQFAGVEPDSVDNFTNRSPYPTFHLLREESISEIAAKPEELLRIPERNTALLRQIGLEKMKQKLASIQ